MQIMGVTTLLMIVAQFLGVGMSTLVKASMSKGMSNFVFVAYSNLLAFCFLLPLTFIYHRNKALPPINNWIIFRTFLISFLSFSAQTIMYIGLGYSSPTLLSTMEDLVPAFTFTIAIISRMEKVDIKLRSFQAKSIGTMVSIAGALIVTLYKGFPITSDAQLLPKINIIVLTNNATNFQSDWLLGGFLLAAGSFCISILLIIQTWTIKEYPAELMLTTICCSFVVVLSFIVAFIAEENPNAWILKPDIELLTIFYSAIFGISMRSVVCTWACRKTGPIYVAMFTPLGIVIALAMGVIFLGDSLYVGSMIGAAIIAIGFYAVMWGQAQEENMVPTEKCSTVSSSSSAVPLLLNKSMDTSTLV